MHEYDEEGKTGRSCSRGIFFATCNVIVNAYAHVAPCPEEHEEVQRSRSGGGKSSGRSNMGAAFNAMANVYFSLQAFGGAGANGKEAIRRSTTGIFRLPAGGVWPEELGSCRMRLACTARYKVWTKNVSDGNRARIRSGRRPRAEEGIDTVARFKVDGYLQPHVGTISDHMGGGRSEEGGAWEMEREGGWG